MKNFITLIKESFEIYKQKIKPILMLLAVFLATAIIFGLSFAFLLATQALAKSSLFFLIFGIILLTMICFVFIGLSFLILVVKPVGTKLKEIFQDAWKKLWGYLLISILVGFFTILSFLLLFIPGLIVGIYLMLCPYVFIIEGGKGMNVLKRSWALVKGNWWEVFGRIILLNIAVMIIFSIFNSANNLLGSLFQSLCMPFSMIFMYLIYLELKKSKEIQIQPQE